MSMLIVTDGKTRTANIPGYPVRGYTLLVKVDPIGYLNLPESFNTIVGTDRDYYSEPEKQRQRVWYFWHARDIEL